MFTDDVDDDDADDDDDDVNNGDDDDDDDDNDNDDKDASSRTTTTMQTKQARVLNPVTLSLKIASESNRKVGLQTEVPGTVRPCEGEIAFTTT